MPVKEREYIKAYTASQSNLFFSAFIMAYKRAIWGEMEANVYKIIVVLALIFKYY